MDRSSGGDSLTGTVHITDCTVQRRHCNGTHAGSWRRNDPVDILMTDKISNNMNWSTVMGMQVILLNLTTSYTSKTQLSSNKFSISELQRNWVIESNILLNDTSLKITKLEMKDI